MIQPAFDIKNHDLANTPDDCRLLIELSAQAFNYLVFKDTELFLLRQYRLYTSADKTSRDLLEEIISGDNVIQQYSGRSVVIYNFPESSILPAQLFDTNLKTPVTNLLYGSTDHHFIFDEPV